MQCHALVLLLLLLSSCTARENTVVEGDPAIHGTWRIVSLNGKNLVDLGINIHWKFDNGFISVIDGETGAMVSKSAYRVSTASTPKRIDMEIKDIEEETRLGVYRIRNGKLQIMFSVGGGPRPVKFLLDKAAVFQKLN